MPTKKSRTVLVFAWVVVVLDTLKIVMVVNSFIFREHLSRTLADYPSPFNTASIVVNFLFPVLYLISPVLCLYSKPETKLYKVTKVIVIVESVLLILSFVSGLVLLYMLGHMSW